MILDIILTLGGDKSNIMVLLPVYNASNGPSAFSQEERIPAWKRLGLKLKNVKDTKEAVSSTNSVLPNKLKQSSPSAHSGPRVDGSLAEPLAKRRRVESHANGHTQTNGSLAGTSGILPKDQAARLKKKVSFTAETKLEDGGKELITGWEQDDYAYYEQKAAENDAKEARRDFASAQKKSEESKIFSKKPSSTPRKSKDALDYLNLYYRSRCSWKFSKNREVWILQHILSTNDIPTSFNIALASYVHGLGSRQARSRLLNQCQEALEKEGPKESPEVGQDSDLDHMEDLKRQKAYHDYAVGRFKRSLEDHLNDEQRQADEDDPQYQRWLSRRRRAELLLWAVTPSASSTEGSSVSSHEVKSEPQSSTSAKSADIVSKNGVIPGGHLLKKKNRTVVVEASSSSEDESGSSDEEDDSSKLANGKSVSNQLMYSSSSADEAASTASSGDGDSTSEEESTTITSGSTESVPLSDDESGMDIPSALGKRQQSAISISSRSETSTVQIPSTSDETYSSASTEDDDEQDESDSRSSTTAIDTQSSMDGDSETSGDDEGDGQGGGN